MGIDVACVLDAGAKLGEGAAWDPGTGKLWWVDIAAPSLHLFDPATGKDQCWDMPSAIGCVAPRAAGGAIVGLEAGWHGFDPESGALTLLDATAPGRGTHRFNDGAVDPVGRFWAGTMPKAGPRDRTAGDAGDGELFRLDADRTCTRMLDGLYIQNGLAFAPDGQTMYLSDSYAPIRTIWAFDLDLASGTIGNRREFFDTRQVEGRPDGATMDADGCYWMAGIDGWQIVRITPAGEVDRIIPVPVEKPTCLAFGGRDGSELFITCMGPGLISAGTEAQQPKAGGLFVCRPGVAGHIPPAAGA